MQASRASGTPGSYQSAHDGLLRVQQLATEQQRDRNVIPKQLSDVSSEGGTGVGSVDSGHPSEFPGDGCHARSRLAKADSGAVWIKHQSRPPSLCGTGESESGGAEVPRRAAFFEWSRRSVRQPQSYCHEAVRRRTESPRLDLDRLIHPGHPWPSRAGAVRAGSSMSGRTPSCCTCGSRPIPRSVTSRVPRTVIHAGRTDAG